MGIINKQSIDDFYAIKRVAVVGASRGKAEYGRMLFDDLLKRGFEAIPVNPNASEIAGKKCYKSVKEISPAPQAAFVVVPPTELEKVVLECADAGIKKVWMHEHVMKGVSNPKAIYLCEEKGMECIVGFCPMMFMPDTDVPHKIHGWIMKLFGAYPK